jgi:hypothetical protein
MESTGVFSAKSIKECALNNRRKIIPTLEGIRKEETCLYLCATRERKSLCKKINDAKWLRFLLSLSRTHHFGWDITRLQTTTAVISPVKIGSSQVGFPARQASDTLRRLLMTICKICVMRRDPYTQKNRIYHIGDIDELKIQAGKIQFLPFCMINEFLLKKHKPPMWEVKLARRKLNETASEIYFCKKAPSHCFSWQISLSVSLCGINSARRFHETRKCRQTSLAVCVLKRR